MAINATKTIAVYDLDGSTEFLIPFEYLARKFVVVTLLGVDRQTLIINTDYRFVSPTLISLNVAQPVGYTQIELRRFTSATERLVDFHDGSILRAYDLNLSQVQTLHVAEEARDLAGDSIGVNDDGNLDARNRRIVNLANAIDDNDAVNYAMLKLFDESTYNNAQLAETSAAGALVSENKAKASEIRSKEAEATAVASATTAVQAATDAHNSKLAVEEAEAIVVPLVPVVEQASQDAAEAADKAEQAVQDVKDLGAVPVGTIMMFTHKAVPAGYLDLCVPNPTFDILEYPDLAILYPTGVLPSFLNRYPKGAEISTVGSIGAWMIPNHSHVASGTGTVSSSGSHTHSVSGTAASAGDHTHSMKLSSSSGDSRKQPLGRSTNNGGTDTTESAGAHTHSVTGTAASAGAHTHDLTLNIVTSGIKETINSGSSLDVDHVLVTYAIKAAGLLSTEGLMEVTVIKADVEQLKLDVDQVEQAIVNLDSAYKATDADLSGRIDVLDTAYKAADADLSGRIDVLEDKESNRGRTVLWESQSGIPIGTILTLPPFEGYDELEFVGQVSSNSNVLRVSTKDFKDYFTYPYYTVAVYSVNFISVRWNSPTQVATGGTSGSLYKIVGIKY